MAKSPTLWLDRSGYSTVTDDNSGFSLLLEDGFSLLLESGYDLLLQDNVVTPKNPAAWTDPTKLATAWEARDGYSRVTVGVSTERVTQQGTTRVTQQGTTRITEDSEFSAKPSTVWIEL